MNTTQFLPRLKLGLTIGLLSASAAWPSTIVQGGTGEMNGHPVSAYVELDSSQKVLSIGFQISGAAIRDPGTADTAVFLTLPSQVAGTPFTELELDWEPDGHPPPGVYDAPHFDFHFYDIPDALRQTIVGAPTTPDPGPQFRPTGYAPPAATVPGMGGHSYDLTSPEFNGGPFTVTMLYGFYNLQQAFLEAAGKQSFLEAMATAGPAQAGNVIRQPSQYALPSLPTMVPNSYLFSYDAASDQYFVSIGQFSSTTVPEPGSLSLLAVAGIALGVWRRRASNPLP